MFEDYYGTRSLWNNGILGLSGIDWNAVLSDAAPASESIYSQPTLLPVEPAPYVEPVYTQPTPQPVETAPYVEPMYTQPTPQPIESAPYVEPVYTRPTPQSVDAVPYVEPIAQSVLPPVQPEPAPAPLDLGDWNPSMVNLNGLNVLSDPGPAYDPNSIFYFHTGSDIGVPNASGGFDYRGAHPLQYEAGQTYRMLDKKGNVVGTASSPAEMQALVEKSKSLPAYTMELVGNQYGTTLPSGGWLPSKSDAGSLGSMLTNMAALALPAVGGVALGPVLAGGLGTSAAVGTGLGTALGTAAAGTAAGKSIEDILLQSALSGLAAGGLSALTAPKGVPNVGDLQAAAIDTADLLTGLGVNPTLAGQIASGPLSGIGSVGSALVDAAPTVVIGNPGAAIGSMPASSTGGLVGAGLGAVTGATAPTQPVVAQPAPPENQIDVIANYNANVPPVYSPSAPFDVAFSPDYFPAPTTEAPIVVEATPSPPPAPAPVVIPTPVTGIGNPEVVVTGAREPVQNADSNAGALPTDIVVTNKYTPPSTDSTLSSVVGSVAPTLIDPGITKPTTPTDTEKSSLLNDIMKYYALGSGLLDMLGVGQGGGTAAPTTPYTSTLGVLPTFGRGQFTPFQGDYETYGQGPEWNFFGGQ